LSCRLRARKKHQKGQERYALCEYIMSEIRDQNVSRSHLNQQPGAGGGLKISAINRLKLYAKKTDLSGCYENLLNDTSYDFEKTEDTVKSIINLFQDTITLLI
jgi:hypothetical protein